MTAKETLSFCRRQRGKLYKFPYDSRNKTNGRIRSVPPCSLLGVSAPSDRLPLRICYNRAKREGRLLKLKFSGKIDCENPRYGTPSNPRLTIKEQIEEDRLIAKWQEGKNIECDTYCATFVAQGSVCYEAVPEEWEKGPVKSS